MRSGTGVRGQVLPLNAGGKIRIQVYRAGAWVEACLLSSISWPVALTLMRRSSAQTSSASSSNCSLLDCCDHFGAADPSMCIRTSRQNALCGLSSAYTVSSAYRMTRAYFMSSSVVGSTRTRPGSQTGRSFAGRTRMVGGGFVDPEHARHVLRGIPR